MYDFNYVKPGSVDDAIAALTSGDAMPISGGQTLLPTMKARLAQTDTLVDLNAAVGAGFMTDRGGALTISAATTHAAVASAAETASIPGLQGLAGHIGDPQVRNRGTIGGSLANNDPAACYPAAVLALSAQVNTNGRSIAADDYFQGMFDTALNEGEIITSVLFPTTQSSTVIPGVEGQLQAGNYQKFVQPASRFALVGVYVAKFSGGVRVAVTGASENGVFRWSEAEAALSASFSADAVPAAPGADGMIGDIHGTPEYRAHLVHVMTKRAVAAC
jgi:carbon-monoxide dehydrogenase medium subunit